MPTEALDVHPEPQQSVITNLARTIHESRGAVINAAQAACIAEIP
jgi:hypothetical protein